MSEECIHEIIIDAYVFDEEHMYRNKRRICLECKERIDYGEL